MKQVKFLFCASVVLSISCTPSSEKFCAPNPDAVQCVALSRDLTKAALGTLGGTVTVRDVETGNRIIAIPNGQWIGSVAFSANGKTLAIGDISGKILLVEVATGKELGRLEHQGVRALTFSFDEQLLISGGHDASVRVWDLTTWQEKISLGKKHANDIESVAISPDGNVVASGSRDETVRLWNITTGKETRVLEGSKEVRRVSFSPVGNILAVSFFGRSLELWDLDKNVRTVLETFPVSALAFSPDGRFLASGSGGLITLWDVCIFGIWQPTRPRASKDTISE